MATDTSKTAKTVVGAIFIAMPISVMTAVAGNITYSSGIITGISFIVVFGAAIEIVGFLGIAASVYVVLKFIAKDLKGLKNKESDCDANKQRC